MKGPKGDRVGVWGGVWDGCGVEMWSSNRRYALAKMWAEKEVCMGSMYRVH